MLVLGYRGGVEFNPPGLNSTPLEPRLQHNFSGNLGSCFLIPGEDSIFPRNQDLGGD